MSDVYDPAELRAPEQRVREQETTLRQVLTRAAATSPAVQAALQAAGLRPDTTTLEDLTRLPVLRKETLPAVQARALPFGGWLGRPPGQVRRIFVSPGPIYDPEGFGADYWGFAPALYAAGLRRGDVVINTFSYHFTPAGAMFDGALEAMGCVTVPTGVGNAELQVKTMRDLGARGYIGTPSFLATVLQKAVELGGPIALQVAFVSGEPLPDGLRRDLEARHGLRISQGYAIGDLGLVAYECAERAGLHLSDRVVVELVDPQSGARVPAGEAGEVVVTHLSDLYPIVRLGTGDLSRISHGACACGRTAARLERILGRVGDAVKVRGIFLHAHDLDRAVARHPEVIRYQAVVTRRDHQDELTVRVETSPGTQDAVAGRLAQSLRELTRLRPAVEVLPPGTLGPDEKKLVDRRAWD